MSSTRAFMGRGVGPRPVAVAVSFLIGFAPGCVPDRPVHTPLDRLVHSWPCREAVGDLLRSAGVGTDFLIAPPRHHGGSSVRIPVQGRLGSWVVLHRAPGAGVTMERWDDAQVTIRVLDEACRVGQEEPASAQLESDGPSFTDGELRAVVSQTRDFEGTPGRSGGEDFSAVVVYAWSPHMPLSVEGFRAIEAAASELGLRVVPVLFAGSDPEFARREAARVGMPPAALREVQSVELMMRDMQVHAPSILVFRRGGVSPVLPGYRNAAGYRRYLTDLVADGSH